MVETICPKTHKPCRHASNECIKNYSRVGVIATGLIERREIVIKMGVRCNNDGRNMVADMATCPIPDALNAPAAEYPTELMWARGRAV